MEYLFKWYIGIDDFDTINYIFYVVDKYLFSLSCDSSTKQVQIYCSNPKSVEEPFIISPNFVSYEDIKDKISQPNILKELFEYDGFD